MTAPVVNGDEVTAPAQVNPDDGTSQASVYNGVTADPAISARTLVALEPGETPVIGARRIDHNNSTDYGFGALGIEYVLTTTSGVLIPDVAGLTGVDVLANDAPGGSVTGDDIDRDAITITVKPTHGASAAYRGSIWYAPVAGHEGDDELTYTVDSRGGDTSDPADVAISVASVATPSLETITKRAARRETISIEPGLALAAYENTPVVQAVEITTAAVEGVASIVGRRASYTAPADFAGRDTFAWRVMVDGVWTEPGTVNIEVGPSRFMRGPLYSRNRRWPKRIAGAGVASEPLPELQAIRDSAITAFGTPITIDVLENDIGEGISVFRVGPAPNGTVVDNEDGTVTYTPNSTFSGVETIPYRITDNVRTSGSTIQVTVLPPSLSASDDAATTDAGDPVVIPVLDNDEGVDLFVDSVTEPDHGTAEITDDDTTVTYTPDEGWAGVDSFTYTIEDGAGQQATATVQVTTVAAIAASADAATTTTTTPVEISVLDNDTGDDLAVVEVDEPAHGTAEITGGGTTVTYTADADFVGVDTFLYTIEDTYGQQRSASIVVRVLETPNPPVVAEPDVATTPVNTPVEISVLANDAGTDLTVTSVSRLPVPTDDGSGSEVQGEIEITGDGATVTFTPYPAFAGETAFSYTCSDGSTESSADVIVTVPRPAINARDDAAVAVQGVLKAIDVLANDTVYGEAAVFATQAIAAKTKTTTCPKNTSILIDPRDVCYGANLTIVSASDPPHGTASVNAAGTRVAYSPDTNYTGADSFTYTITDGIARHSSTVSITVEAAPETVIANDDEATAEFETAVLIPVLDNDSGSGPLVVSSVGTPSSGAAAISGSSIRYTPNSGFSGSDSFNYTARLASGAATDSAAVRVTVRSGSQFVRVATPYWTTVSSGNVTRPSWSAQAENKFNPGAGKVVDLRDREGRNHIAGQQGRVTLVQLTAAAGAGVYGFKCRGMQAPGDTSPATGPTNPLPWQAMKFGSFGNFQTGSLASDGSWDDKHVKINGSINGTVYVEDFASYDAMDGIDTGDSGNQNYKLVMNRFYARGARDDFIQNDQLKEIECNDFLVDGTHFFCSVRPGGSLTSTKNITFNNGLIRLRRQRYYGDWGGGGSASWNQNALYTAPWNGPSNLGLPSLVNGRDGYGHNQLIKDSAGFQGRVFMTNCLILMESRPLGGPTSLVWPSGTYTNVVVCYVGETTNLGPTPTGVTIISDRDTAWNLWQTERQRWLVAHGDTTGTGNDFSFLHA